MLMRTAIAATLLIATPVAAQDTFVPTHGKAACEFWSGTSCALAGRPRTRIVRVPVTTYRPHRLVPEHLEPIRPRLRVDEVRAWRDRDDDWRRDHERRLREHARCWPVKMEAQSDEKVARDAKAEAIRRWNGVVRVKLGELYMDWKNAVDKKELCFQSSTGERIMDKMTGGNERCMVEARPCRAEKTRDGDDE